MQCQRWDCKLHWSAAKLNSSINPIPSTASSPPFGIQPAKGYYSGALAVRLILF
ncbi:hypothetical protein NDU88_003070 [Pleurodeles waltl]|uniref:Uncharacterized protein n=1 Tax=Pleurodeles waltl TaxID=8319 RepID=A0AAV7M5V6_PLEWA|nr:hypothetical protein NDU88_003070 [Pleurodeles waltl]